MPGPISVPEAGIEYLYLFPYSQTREQYRQLTGEEAPPFNRDKPRKYWFDPSARSTEESYMLHAARLHT